MFITLSVLCLISIIAIVIRAIYYNDFLLILAITPVIIVLVLLLVYNTTPTAMDVYQNKTTLKYTIIDDVKTDSVVVWKKEFNN